MKMKIRIAISALALLVSLLAGAQGSSVVTDTLQFDRALSSTPATMLQGQISGVRVSATDGNINGAQNIYIRGVNALRGDSQPLWIVDGVIINSSLNQNREAFFNYDEESYSSPINALAGIDLYDIESIEVLKDISATAIYGSKGANGAIIIKTKRGSKDGFDINWRSNVGLSTSPVKGTVKGISHNHWISLGTSKDKTDFNMSAFLRKTNGVLSGNDNLYGGVSARFDTKASDVLQFGATVSAAMGKANSIAGAAYSGKPSRTLLMRYPSLFAGNTLEGWQDDYDDEADERRVSGSAYLDINFTPSLSWKNSIGIDYQNIERYIWYGNGTSFGLENNGAAGILMSGIFKYNIQSLLSWDKTFSEKHNVAVSGAFEASGDWTNYNATNSSDFFSHILRGRGLDLGSNASENHYYNHEYNTFGGFAEASYDYDGIAGADATVRADRTAKYDNGAKIYWAANAFVDLRKALLSDAEAVSTLKLKAGYGTAGKEQYIPYGYFGNYLTDAYPVPDNESTFEKYYDGVNLLSSKEFNVGVDFGALCDRFFVHAGYYSKSTDDNFTIYDFNAGAETLKALSKTTTVSNKGFEADLNLGIVRNSVVTWDVFGNIAINTNSFVSTDEKDAVSGLLDNFVPKSVYGIGTTLKAYGFALDILADGASGFNILNLGEALYNGATSFDKYVEKGDFFRLSRVSLGYSIPVEKIKWIKAIDLSLSGLNLLTATKYSGWNPDVNCFGTSAFDAGRDYGSYPSMRSVVLGINLKF